METVFIVCGVLLIVVVGLYIWAETASAKIEDDLKVILNHWREGPDSDEINQHK